MTTRYNIL